LYGKFVLVVDDDELVRDGMCRVLRGWGCRAMAVASADAARAALPDRDQWPDLIISDYRLADGVTGIAAIEQLRRRAGYDIPTILMSGDTAPERRRAAAASGHQLVHKPIPPMALRAMISGLLKEPATARDSRPPAAAEAAAASPRGDVGAETNEYS
jgi:CheY-like chemotaxis protein